MHLWAKHCKFFFQAQCFVRTTLMSFSREDLLGGGLPARRASMLLFAIENRTAQLAGQDVRDAAVYLSLAGTQTREQDFFAALASGRATTTVVTIQQLERFAPQWRLLLPETPDPKLNAALADLIGKKYKFTRDETPNLRAVLTLEDAATRQAFQTGFDKALDTIYAPQLDAGARARFAWAHVSARLESIPPFWLAFLLTMPGAAGLLALPVALARVGPGGGLLLLVAFGLLNMLTAAMLAEATARSGVTRFGLGWLGQLVQEYLGGAGSLLLTAILALNNFFVLIIFYLGVGGTLQDAVRVPATVWIVVLFAICLFFLSRGSLNATIASTLIIVLLSILLLIAIPLLALPHFELQTLLPADSAIPFISLDFASVQLGFGVLLSTFFSHILVATYGPVVIRRDASARAWIWGSAAAILGFLLIACIWLIVVNGTVSREMLANAPGTVLTPLAEKAGPAVLWLGSLLVILSLGLASIQIALGLYYLVQERLPAPGKSPRWSSPRVRFVLGILPIGGVFVLAEWVALTGQGSFTAFLGILGAFALPLLGGVFPVLLFAATRRQGDFVPDMGSRGFLIRLPSHPILLALLYFFFVGIIFLYGVVIFTDPLTQALMVGVGMITLLVTAIMLWRGAMSPRLVVRLWQDQRHGNSSGYAIVQAGDPAPARVELEFDAGKQARESWSGEFSWQGFRALRVRLAEQTARRVKIWLYSFTPEGDLQGRAARVEIQDAGRTEKIELSRERAEALVPIVPGALNARIETP